jgi:GrpB-like predicted nucleotidyltransferase (UPF0157 family)
MTTQGSAPVGQAPAAAPVEGQGSAPAQGQRPQSQGKPGVTETSAVDRKLAELRGGSEGEETPEAKETKAQEKRRYKVKDGDEELEVDEDEVVKGYQRARSANKRFEEAAAKTKQVEQVIRALSENPLAVLERVAGGDKTRLRTMFEDYLKQEYAMEMVPEDQRKYMELEAKLARYEEQEQTAQQKAQEEAFNKKKAQSFDNYAKKFTQALQIADVPKSPFVVKRMAEYEKQAREGGYELSAQELGELVAEDFEKERRPSLSGMEGDRLLKHLGDDVVKKVLQAAVQRAKPRIAAAPASGQGGQGQKKSEKMTVFEHQEAIRRKYGL